MRQSIVRIGITVSKLRRLDSCWRSRLRKYMFDDRQTVSDTLPCHQAYTSDQPERRMDITRWRHRDLQTDSILPRPAFNIPVALAARVSAREGTLPSVQMDPPIAYAVHFAMDEIPKDPFKRASFLYER
jgi:hypothetical protein